MSVRFRLIAVAVAVGAIVFTVYRNRHDNTVKSPGLPISVLVAKGPIRRGTTGDSIRKRRLYTRVAIPRTQVERGAIVDPGQLEGKVAVSDVADGHQLTSADFRQLKKP